MIKYVYDGVKIRMRTIEGERESFSITIGTPTINIKFSSLSISDGWT